MRLMGHWELNVCYCEMFVGDLGMRSTDWVRRSRVCVLVGLVIRLELLGHPLEKQDKKVLGVS